METNYNIMQTIIVSFSEELNNNTPLWVRVICIRSKAVKEIHQIINLNLVIKFELEDLRHCKLNNLKQFLSRRECPSVRYHQAESPPSGVTKGRWSEKGDQGVTVEHSLTPPFLDSTLIMYPIFLIIRFTEEFHRNTIFLVKLLNPFDFSSITFCRKLHIDHIVIGEYVLSLPSKHRLHTALVEPHLFYLSDKFFLYESAVGSDAITHKQKETRIWGLFLYSRQPYSSNKNTCLWDEWLYGFIIKAGMDINWRQYGGYRKGPRTDNLLRHLEGDLVGLAAQQLIDLDSLNTGNAHRRGMRIAKGDSAPISARIAKVIHLSRTRRPQSVLDPCWSFFAAITKTGSLTEHHLYIPG